MRRLWKTAPPLYSDIMGLEAVVNLTSGMAVIDDSDGYKPLRLRISDDWDSGMPRVVDSRIRTIDIISGTEGRVLDAFAQSAGDFDSDFVLLSHAPSSTMISSDLDAAAQEICEKSGLPVGCVSIDGSKDYLHGIAETLCAMGTLLLEDGATIPRSVNILGANAIDWVSSDVASLEAWLAEKGWTVLSAWGLREPVERLRNATDAEMNLVVDIAGLALARQMERDLGIPYIVGAPYGSDTLDSIATALERAETTVLPSPAQDGDPSVLIIGEQLFANAIRNALAARGMGPARVLSFARMEKDAMAPGDAKLADEDALASALAESSVELVLADPDLKPLAARDIPWIALPNVASQFPIAKTANLPRFGAALDAWLDEELAHTRKE